VKRLPDYAREGRIHGGERALGGRVLPTPQSAKVMVFGAGAAALLSGTNGTLLYSLIEFALILTDCWARQARAPCELRVNSRSRRGVVYGRQIKLYT